MTTMRPGLCSVTYRTLAPEQIITMAAQARLAVIEWGADEHVRPGDIARARAVAAATTDAGLSVCSYGSYFRAGPDESVAAVLDTAEALGTDRVRVWAGSVGSDEATAEVRAQVVDRLQQAASDAAARGIDLALEFHSGTLADSAPATLRLLGEVDSRALSTYWQPTVGATGEAVVDEYRAIAAHTTAAHVFSWWPAHERLPLRALDALWTRFFAEALAAPAPPRDALLEFVPGDDPALLVSEAATLRSYLGLPE